MHYVRACLSVTLSISIMVLIFLFSCQNAGESGSLSDSIGRFLAGVFVAGYTTMSQVDQQSWVDMLSFPIRKTAHASEYACLALSLTWSCWELGKLKTDASLPKRAFEKRFLRICLAAFSLTVIYACTDELHQLFVDGRSGQVSDVMVDASGAALACLLVYLVARRQKSRQARS